MTNNQIADVLQLNGDARLLGFPSFFVHGEDERGARVRFYGMLEDWLREQHYIHVDIQPNIHFCWQGRLIDIGYGGMSEEFPVRDIDKKWLMYDYGNHLDCRHDTIAAALTFLSTQK